jgi:hypothetical protein
MEDYKERVVKGWTDLHGKDHYWHLSYNPTAPTSACASDVWLEL